MNKLIICTHLLVKWISIFVHSAEWLAVLFVCSSLIFRH